MSGLTADGQRGSSSVSELDPRNRSPAARLVGLARLAPREVAMFAVIGAIWLTFDALTDGLFLTPRNLTFLAIQIAITGVLAGGMAMLLISREIDLSVGSALSLTTVVAASLHVEAGLGTGTVIAVVLAMGVAMGAAQGMLVALAGIPSFIVTLGGLLTFQGLSFVISDSQTIGPLDASFFQISGGFVGTTASGVLLGIVAALVVIAAVRARRRPNLVLARLALLGLVALVSWASLGYLGVPYALVLLGASIVAVEVALSKTRFGRRVYAVGGDPEAARYAGISRPRLIIQLFATMGLLYGVAGIMLTSRLDGAPPNAGLGLELDVISAVILGGVSLFGGEGNVRAAMIGVLLFGSLTSGMNLMNVDSNTQLLIKGLILIAAVWVDAIARRRTVPA